MSDENSIKNLVSRLLSVLEEQIKLYRHLLEIVRKEKDILISANLDELNENNRAKEAMLIKIRALETERMAVSNELHLQLKIVGDEPRLMEIARHLHTEEAEKMRNVHSVLELLLRRVQEYSRQNEVLVQSALSNITGAMNAIKGSLQEKPTYQKKGEVEGHTSAGQLVSRAA